jgi:uncharacterized membrane protein
MVLSTALYCIYARRRLPASAALAAVSLLCGALLALFGQVYQTGADTWQLFAVWALCILPWVAISRLDALWLFWVGLIDVSIMLYMTVFGLPGWLLPLWFAGSSSMVLFFFNITVLAVWESVLHTFRHPSGRWAPDIIAAVAGTAITVLAFSAVTDHKGLHYFDIAVWSAWLWITLYVYSSVKKDLFVISGAMISPASIHMRNGRLLIISILI